MSSKIHLIYRRIPNRVLERDDEVIADLGDIVVAKSRFEGMLTPLRVNGVEVIKNGYTMVYFAFVGKNYDILKVYDTEGNFKGLYIDVLAYTKREGNVIEMLDLFLDIFVFPDGRAFLLDEDELEMAFNYGLIDRRTLEFAYSVARAILERLKRGEFPPEIVWRYEWGEWDGVLEGDKGRDCPANLRPAQGQEKRNRGNRRMARSPEGQNQSPSS